MPSLIPIGMKMNRNMRKFLRADLESWGTQYGIRVNMISCSWNKHRDTVIFELARKFLWNKKTKHTTRKKKKKKNNNNKRAKSPHDAMQCLATRDCCWVQDTHLARLVFRACRPTWRCESESRRSITNKVFASSSHLTAEVSFLFNNYNNYLMSYTDEYKARD